MGYFQPRKNTSYSRYVFRQESQHEGETVSQFMIRLCQVGGTCDYGDFLNDFIRDQIINGCRSNRLRTRLLAEGGLTLEKTMDISVAIEASECQAAQTKKVARNIGLSMTYTASSCPNYKV